MDKQKLKEYFDLISDEQLLDLYKDFVAYAHYDPHNSQELYMGSVPVDENEVYEEILKRMKGSLS